MTAITDDFMKGMLTKSKVYTLVRLIKGPNYDKPELRPVIWEHGRRNFELRAAGKLALVGPVYEGGDLVGIGIFTVDRTEASRLMDEDPGVKAGIFTYLVADWKSFPGDALP